MKNRLPDSLRLEAKMMTALVGAGWSTPTIVGWIAAQRRDGLLSSSATPWIVSAQLVEWGLMTTDRIDAECRLLDAEMALRNKTLTDEQL